MSPHFRRWKTAVMSERMTSQPHTPCWEDRESLCEELLSTASREQCVSWCWVQGAKAVPGVLAAPLDALSVEPWEGKVEAQVEGPYGSLSVSPSKQARVSRSGMGASVFWAQ